MTQPLALHWLPTDPPRPCPDVLTAEEAVTYLRIDATGVKHPLRSLDTYRAQGLIKGVQIGKHIRYRRTDLDQFIQRKAEDEPR